VVSAGAGREQRVLCTNAAAEACGISPGLRVSAALALAHHLRVMARDVRAERRALERLATWAGQYSSLVHVALPDVLLLEAGGSLKLFGGLPGMLARIEFTLAELGYGAQLAVAPTPLAATWLARAGHDVSVTEPVTEPARLAGALAELPLPALALAPEVLAQLEGMGLARLGDCLRLPRAGLARRLGPEFLRALDRALGRAADPRTPFVPPVRFASRLDLPDAVDSLEGIAFALHRLVLDLCGELRARGAGAMRFALTLRHPGAPPTVVELGLVAPRRDPRHLTDLLRAKLAQIMLPAPVEALALSVTQHRPLGARPLDLLGAPESAEETAAALIERLRARLGLEAVEGLGLMAEHRPERASAPVPVGGHPGPSAAPVLARGERPFWLLPEPLPIEQHEQQPWIGSTLTLEAGVERIESGWWDEGDIGRDYFIACNSQGERYWIFRDLAPPRRWWLHGVFG